jgi:hypothetical protein
MPLPLRAFIVALASILLSLALYACIQWAVMLYDWYCFAQWCSAAVE